MSPAPIVSTTSTFSPGAGYTVPSLVNAARPSPPWVITTAEGPASSHSRGVPPSHSASSSDSLRSDTYGSQLLKRARYASASGIRPARMFGSSRVNTPRADAVRINSS